MRLASKLLSPNDRAAIDRAVAEAESRTSAEIVPVVATSSGRYDRAEDTAGLWLGIALLALTWSLWPAQRPQPGSWGGWPGWLEVVALAASVVVGFILGAAITSRVAWLRRLFTPRPMMRDEVHARSRQAFFDARVHRTAGHGGVLIYVSLFEHQSVVLADEQVVERLGQAALDQLCRELTDRLRHGDLPGALCETIRMAGERLAPVLPRQADDVNELPDALVILDKPL